MDVETQEKFVQAVGCYAHFAGQKAAGMRRQQTRFWAEMSRAKEELGVEFEFPRLKLAPPFQEDAA